MGFGRLRLTAATSKLHGRPVVPICQQYAFGIACRIVILAVAQRPDKCPEAQQAKKDRHGDQPDQRIHRYLIRMALSETVKEDRDIAMADISGVAKPSKAIGTARTL